MISALVGILIKGPKVHFLVGVCVRYLATVQKCIAHFINLRYAVCVTLITAF